MNSSCRDLLRLARLCHQHDVGEVRQNESRRASPIELRRDIRAQVLLGERVIALAHLDAIDLGDHRIRRLRERRRDRQREQQRGHRHRGDQTQRQCVRRGRGAFMG